MRESIKKSIAVCLIILTVLLVSVSCDRRGVGGFSITFIDVGQGDAALVSCDGHHMLIDGGPKGAAGRVCAVLREQNVKILDYLIISHMHLDHIGGLQRALACVSKVGKAFSVEESSDSDAFTDLFAELKKDGCRSVRVPKEGDKFSLGSAEIEVIAVGDPAVNENDSLVILVTYGDTDFLFTGDMEHQMEEKIVEKYEDDFPISFLKAAHHGAENSTEIRFIRATMPEYAVISVGEGNRYGHPTEKVLSVLEQAGVKTFRTDKCGNITVTSDGHKISVKTEK